VYDSSQDFFKKFSVNGELLWIEKGLLKDGLWIRSDRIISYNNHMYLGVQESGAGIDWKSRTIVMYNGDGQLSSTFGAYDPDLKGGKNKELYINLNSISLDPAGSKIFTTHRTSPYIQTFDANTGDQISRFGFVSDHFKISNDKPSISDPRPIRRKKNLKQSFVGESFVSNTYFFFHHFHWTEEFWQLQDPNAKPHFLNVFQKDKPHAFLGEIALPYMPLYISTNNEAYLLENDNPENFTIGVYKVSGI